MYRRQFAAMMIAVLTLFPLSAHADARITAASARMPHFIPGWGSVPLGGFVSTDARNVKDDNRGNAYVASAAERSVNHDAPPVANDGTPALIL